MSRTWYILQARVQPGRGISSSKHVYTDCRKVFRAATVVLRAQRAKLLMKLRSDLDHQSPISVSLILVQTGPRLDITVACFRSFARPLAEARMSAHPSSP